MIGNCTGKKSVIIEQDILATIFLYNITQDMLGCAETEQQEKDREKSCKYQMKIYMNIAIGIIKDERVRVALEKNPEKRRRSLKR